MMRSSLPMESSFGLAAMFPGGTGIGELASELGDLDRASPGRLAGSQ